MKNTNLIDKINNRITRENIVTLAAVYISIKLGFLGI